MPDKLRAALTDLGIVGRYLVGDSDVQREDAGAALLDATNVIRAALAASAPDDYQRGYSDGFEASVRVTQRADVVSDDHIAWAQQVRADHEATHGEPEQCGAECIVLGLSEFDESARPAVPALLDEAWRELEMDALASDGPIRDRDVKDAIKRNRARIEAAALAASAPDEPWTDPKG